MKVVSLQKKPRPLHLAAAGDQVELAFLTGEDVLIQDQHHVALDPGHLGLFVDLHLVGADAPVSLADLHVALGGIEMLVGVISELIGPDPPGSALEALSLKKFHFRGPGQAHAEQKNQTSQGTDPDSWHAVSRKLEPQKPLHHNTGFHHLSRKSRLGVTLAFRTETEMARGPCGFLGLIFA